MTNAVRRTRATRRSTTGQSETALGSRISAWRRLRTPTGISTRPIRNSAGRATNTTRPAYGLVSSPARAASSSVRNSTAATVVITTPAIASG
jgi:hypothetical protein